MTKPRITTANIDNELDRLLALAPGKTIVLPGPNGGFTMYDAAKAWGVSVPTACRRLSSMVQAGQLRQIGYRPGAQVKVFQVAT